MISLWTAFRPKNNGEIKWASNPTFTGEKCSITQSSYQGAKTFYRLATEKELPTKLTLFRNLHRKRYVIHLFPDYEMYHLYYQPPPFDENTTFDVVVQRQLLIIKINPFCQS